MKREQLVAQMESFEREMTIWREKTKVMLAQLQALGGSADLIYELEAHVSELNTKLVNLTELRHAVLNGILNGALMNNDADLAAIEAADTAKVSMRAWATPADDRCFPRTVCLDASLGDQDTEACRFWHALSAP